MNFKNIIIVCLCLLANTVFAQNLKGTIKSQNGGSIAFANILVLNNATGTVSDKDGNFSLTLENSTYQIQFSAVGLAPKVQEITTTENAQTLDISLQESTQTLGEVVVYAWFQSRWRKCPILARQYSPNP